MALIDELETYVYEETAEELFLEGEAGTLRGGEISDFVEANSYGSLQIFNDVTLLSADLSDGKALSLDEMEDIMEKARALDTAGFDYDFIGSWIEQYGELPEPKWQVIDLAGFNFPVDSETEQAGAWLAIESGLFPDFPKLSPENFSNFDFGEFYAEHAPAGASLTGDGSVGSWLVLREGK